MCVYFWLFKKGIYFTLCYIIRIPIHPIFAHEYLNSNRHTHTDTESILDPLMNKWIEFILFEKNNESYHCKNIIKKNFGISEFHLYSIHVSIIVWLSLFFCSFVHKQQMCNSRIQQQQKNCFSCFFLYSLDGGNALFEIRMATMFYLFFLFFFC